MMNAENIHNINWETQLQLANSDEFREDTIPTSLDPNTVAAKMQYLTLHPLNRTLTFYQKIAYFNSYEKSRMDLLADISTGTPTMVNSKQFYMELIAGFDKNRILLDRISGLSEFKYQLKLHDCRHGYSSEANQCAPCNRDDVIDENHDFLVAIPNDIIGQHAFYVIIENIIRNTAKHSGGGRAPGEIITFHIEVCDPKADECKNCPELKHYLEIHVYDSIKLETDIVHLTECEVLFFRANGLTTIKNLDIANLPSLTHAEKLVYSQNIHINQPLLDRENKLRQGAWGMIEMEASAAYLRKIPVENIDNDEFTLDLEDTRGENYCFFQSECTRPNILKAFIKESHDKNWHLAYRFFILKPKEILVVIDDSSIIAIRDSLSGVLSELFLRMINYGIWILYIGTEQIQGVDKYEESVIYEHEMLLNLTSSEIKPHVGFHPDRIVNAPELLDLLVKIDSPSSSKSFKETVWANYARIKGLDKIFISAYRRGYTDYQFPLFGDSQSVDILAIFQYHGDKFSTEYANYPASQQHVEIVSGLNNLTDILCKSAGKVGGVNNEECDKIGYFKLLDSINCQIIVLDERIQEAAGTLQYQPSQTDQGSPDPIPFRQLYLASGIYVPEVTHLNFSEMAYKADTRKVLIDLLGEISKIPTGQNGNVVSFNRVRFLVVHLGILEKILKAEENRDNDPSKEGETISALVNQLLCALPNEMGKSVKPIIVSGRGHPANLPEDIPFINYSAISQYLVDTRVKYLLNELLFSTRKIS